MFLPKPLFTREHRLGLVVYGGVSLAIYMNGICREFYDAVRGRGIYKLIKALTDADIIVDIISGTSAGGINGVLLSYALANSNEEEYFPFEEFAKIWIKSGDIKKLLFEREYDGFYKASFFDGAGYYKSQLKEALENIDRKETSRNDWISHAQNLDLFVTGTDLLGRIYETFDNTGRIIEVKDHRSVFHLKWNKTGENAFDFQDQIITEALAKLCQITSCFPGAFSPVTVHLDDANPVDQKLVEWGQLRRNRRLPKMLSRPSQNMPWDDGNPQHQEIKNRIEDDSGRGYRLHFVDGGVLDNRPFTYAIETIYHRTAERRVFRKLFYVDPSPDRFLDNTRYKRMMKPGPLQVVADSLSALPRYESINNDLELIKQHNEKIRRYKFLLADIEAILDREVKDTENQDLRDQQVYVYKRARLLKLKDKLVSRVYLESEDCLQDIKDEEGQKAEPNDRLQLTNAHFQLTKDFQKLIEELTARLDVDPELTNSLDAAHDQVNALLRQEQDLSARRNLDKAVELLTKPLEPDENVRWVRNLERVYRETDGLDIEYALRKHLFIVNYIHELLDVDTLYKWFEQKSSCFGENKPSKRQLLLSDQNLKSLMEELQKKLQGLIKDLNQCVRYVQAINDEIENFFSSRLVSKYFKDLIKDKELNREFPFEFYKIMCFLHKMLLYVEQPGYSDDIQPPEPLKSELEGTSKRIQKKLDEYKKLLNKIPCLKEISLEELTKETANSLREYLLKESGDKPPEPISVDEISILQIFSFIAEQLIECHLSASASFDDKTVLKLNCDPQIILKERLKQYFTDFKKLDEFLFPLDYLAGISGKQLIETYRISPEDARYGLSTSIQRGKRLEQKLAGDSLNAFGGFFKESWRENDILWGRLDGLNRIIESLVTDEQVKKFPDFWERQARQFSASQSLTEAKLPEAKEQYLDHLLNAVLSIKPSEQSTPKQQFKQDLKQDLKEKIKTLNDVLTHTNNLEQREQEIAKHRAILVQALVKAGHLLILQEERQTVSALDTALTQSSHYQYDKLREDKKLEAAFRDHYKIGLETLQDIPKSDWKEIESRGVSIAKDIIKTYRHQRYTRLAPKLITSYLKTENGDWIKLFFIVLLLPVFVYLAIGLLVLCFISLPFLALLLVSYVSSKISRKPRRFKRLKFTIYRYLVALENLLYKGITSLAISIFRVIFSLVPRWKQMIRRKSQQSKRRGSKRGDRMA